MGCCVSSATTDHQNDAVSSDNKEPPPAITVVEEETIVKEVLSETTLLTSSIENSTMESPKTKILQDEKRKPENNTMETPKTKILQDEKKKPENVEIAPNPILPKSESIDLEKGLEEVSEICSLSESVQSTVNGYDEEESKQRRLVRQRSPAKSRNRAMVNYPTRGTDISPRKRKGEGAGSARRSNSPATNRSRTERRSNSPATNRSRAERRSKSPAMNRSVLGPAQNYNSTVSNKVTRKKNQSPGRIRPDPNKAGSGENQDRHNNHQYMDTGNDDSTLNDSLENPLVSLECFIFL